MRLVPPAILSSSQVHPELCNLHAHCPSLPPSPGPTDPRQVILGEVLGQGSFGTVHRGTWRGGVAAVKCIRVTSRSEAISFLREVEALSLVRHANVMPMYGECKGGIGLSALEVKSTGLQGKIAVCRGGGRQLPWPCTPAQD